MNDSSEPIVLVYYRVRGKAQPIRNLLAYLGRTACEVYLEEQEQKKNLPECVCKCLRSTPIDKTQLPLLCHEGLKIYDVYPILAYLCRRFDHAELLGRDMQQRAKLQEVVELLVQKDTNMLANIMKLAENSYQKEPPALLQDKKVAFNAFFEGDWSCMKELCTLLERRGAQSFLLGDITVVDFMFLETCQAVLGCFNNIDSKDCCAITCIKEFFSSDAGDNKKNYKYLRVMRSYLQLGQCQPFYEQNREHLEGFSMRCVSFTPQRTQGMRKLWVMNPSFVA